MEMLRNIVQSVICSVLIASLSIPIVYAFDTLLGGSGLVQVTQDLKHMVPEESQISTHKEKFLSQMLSF